MVAKRWPVYLALLLLIGFTVVFIVVFIIASDAPPPNTVLTEDIYAERVAELLADTDPENGAELVREHSCTTCHVAGVDVGIAPPFAGLVEAAATRRPPLSAADYLYESIVDPQAYIVEGYSGAMPQNFDEQLSDEELGDILAYLLTDDE